jgi:putative addiction module CopG family antidote
MEIYLPEDLQRFVDDQVRTGRFPSEDQVVREALEQFKQAQAPGPTVPAAQETGTREERPLWEVIAGIASRVSDEEWAKLPTDASYQLDHYLYGAPKKPL